MTDTERKLLGIIRRAVKTLELVTPGTSFEEETDEIREDWYQIDHELKNCRKQGCACKGYLKEKVDG